MLNPSIASLKPYAFTELVQRQAELRARGVELIDFGVGDPQDPTPEFIRRALVHSVSGQSRYPTAAGLPELRRAIAGWIGRRYGAELDAERHVLPANGSKEAIFNLALMVLDDPRRSRNVVAVPELAYQVYADSAALHHADVLEVPLDERWLPDLNAITPEVARHLRLLWLNYPNNPTGAVASAAYYREALGLARRWEFVLASDEAYSELWFDQPPGSLLEVAAERTPDLDGAVVLNTLSKRSNMTAYRSGFIAGDASLVATMRNVRPRMGVATPEFVQRAAIAAWGDEAHVAAQRQRYAERRALLLDLFRRKGVQVAASAATFYLWVRVPERVPDRSSLCFAEQLLEHGIIVLPGAFLGRRGAEYVRFALVPPLGACQRAVEILEGAL